MTVTVTALELTLPEGLVMRTQNEVVTLSAGVVRRAAFPPLTGDLVFPTTPLYHWKVGEVPVATTLSLAVLPEVIVTGTGCLVMTGAMMTGAAWIASMALCELE